MDSQRFKELQPIAYQTMVNSIHKDCFAHAYLFYGSPGVELSDYAEFFIASILCEDPQDGLACGICNNCQRIAKGFYADLVILSGAERLIGKNEILQMMSKLNKTGLENKVLKFYLIRQVDNATREALNSLLKFLEEPGNERTYAILTTNQIDRVLPTIVSRCIKVPFQAYPKKELWEALGQMEISGSESYLLSCLAKTPKKAELLAEDEVFQRAQRVFRKGLELYRNNYHSSLVLLEQEGLVDKKNDKDFLVYWLALNIQFLKDLSYQQEIPAGWYRDLLTAYELNKAQSVKMLPVYLGVYDQLNLPLNTSLLVEKLFWQLKEITA